MHGSTDTVGATTVQNSPQGEASFGGTDYRGRCGAAKASVQGLRLKSGGLAPCLVNTDNTDFAALMEEAPHGINHGRQSRILDPEDSAMSRWQPLDRRGQVARDHLTSNDGWQVVDASKGQERGGGTFSHRGILAEDAHLDPVVLELAVEDEFGFTIEQVRSVYRQGPLTESQRELRGQIDARLLALSRAGGHMLQLARIFGWTIKVGGKGDSCDTMERAVARARSAEAVSDE